MLDDLVMRVIASNAGVMTGAGTNTYLVGRDELIVIDPGPEEPAHIQAVLAAGAGRIRRILCTHTHPDHAAAADALRKRTAAPLAGLGSPDTAHDVNVVMDQILTDGESVAVGGHTVRVLATPGHASNHLCFLLEETGMLFTGDHIMQGSTVVIWPPDGNMGRYLESLRRLHDEQLNILAPGHGYLIGNPYAEVDRLIQHRLRREDKVRSTLRACGGAATLETLLPRVYSDVSQSLHPIAARSLQAHLDHLLENNEVTFDAGCYVCR